MKAITFLMLCISTMCSASVFQIGSSRTYTSPNALYQAGVVQDGDTLEIDVEIYAGTACLAVWQNDDLLIRGVGGRPHLKAEGEYIWGKGIWVLAGNNITVENIEFSEASVPDQNGAGIRLDGVGLTVRHCYFHHNENGILTSNPFDGDILIEYSEFDNNGYGDGFSHNLYIGHVNSLTFRFNYSHHAFIGHNLKSRANENFILYNRIMDEETGASSRLIDLSNGGFSIVMGNIFMQGENAENNNLVGYGLEGLSNEQNEIYFINNTAVNKRQASCIFLDIEEGTEVAMIVNNIFAGSGTLMNGTATTMSHNLTDANIDNLLFIDEANYEYQLYSNSPAVDMGTSMDSINGYSLTPAFDYEHPTYFKNREISNSTIDIGAYEYIWITSNHNISKNEIEIYPNPFIQNLTIKRRQVHASEISLFNMDGKQITSNCTLHSDGENTIIQTRNLPKGVYILSLKSENIVIYKH